MHTKYRHTGEGRSSSHLRTSLHDQNRDWLSGIPARPAGHPFRVFGSMLVSLMLISIACDPVNGRSYEGILSELPAIHQTADTHSTNDSSEAQAIIIPPAAVENRSVFSQLFWGGLERRGENLDWRDSSMTLAFRLTLAAMLGAVVAFRPRRFSSSRHRNPDVVQTQILLAVVACALMMIVGDSAARAFGIFAAASMVRFRTNISDPKEITVLLITLGVGLAAGVGRWELATIFALFALFLLEILEWYERHQVVRLVEFKVRTHDVEATDEAVRNLFRRNNLPVDIRERNKETEKHALGKLVYSLDIGSKLNTDRLAEEIYSADPNNIDRIELHRKKDHSDA